MIHTFSGLIRSLELLEIRGIRSAVASSSEMILNLDTRSFKVAQWTTRNPEAITTAAAEGSVDYRASMLLEKSWCNKFRGDSKDDFY
jgi:hypothetical protein